MSGIKRIFNALFNKACRSTIPSFFMILIILFCAIPGCNRNNSSSMDNEEKSNTPSDIVITSPSAGPVSGLITIHAEISDFSRHLKCTFKDNDLTDADDRSFVFSAVVDTTFYPDGSANINCLADGDDQVFKKTEVLISNQNPVSFSVFVTEQVADLNSIVVFSETGKLVTVLKPGIDGKISAKLPTGVFIFEVSGGNYISKALSLGDKSGNPHVISTFRQGCRQSRCPE